MSNVTEASGDNIKIKQKITSTDDKKLARNTIKLRVPILTSKIRLVYKGLKDAGKEIEDTDILEGNDSNTGRTIRQVIASARKG